jgi:NTE family protein
MAGWVATMNCDLVLEGGGTKLPGLVGAYRVLRDQDFTPINIAGTSAGSIVGALIAAGYTPEEMRELLYDMSFSEFLDGARWPWQKGWNFFKHWGIYKGDHFEEYIRSLLSNRGIVTFGDLLTDRKQDLSDPRYRWKLKVVVSDVTNKKLAIFPNDAKIYGADPDKMDVASTIRMSMAIPFFFRPVKWQDTLFVDGGMLSNFPIWLFDSDGEPEWPTFGLLLREQDYGQSQEYTRLGSYIKGLINTMLQAHDRKNIRPEDHFHRTIMIPTGKIGTTDFDMSVYDKQVLYHNGRNTANEFFDSWDWESYKNWAVAQRGR